MQLRTFRSRARARIVTAHVRARMHGCAKCALLMRPIVGFGLAHCPCIRQRASARSYVAGRKGGWQRCAPTGGTIPMGSRAQGGLIYKDSVLVLLLRIVASSLCFSDMQVGSGHALRAALLGHPVCGVLTRE